MEHGGFRIVLRIVLFVVILFNAVTLVVYLRTQEIRLQYRLSRAEADFQREERAARDLSQELLRASQRENLVAEPRSR